MLNHYRSIILIFYCTLFTSACNFTPKYQRDTSIFKEKEHLAEEQPQQISDQDLARWWQKLQDPVSERLVKELLSKNLSLQEAEERLYQARAIAKIQSGKLLPGAEARITASQIGGQAKQELRSAGGTVSWQLDLFGKLRASRNAAMANFVAQKYDVEALTHSLIAEVVSRRIAIYLNNQLLVAAKLNLHDAENLKILATKRYEFGTKNTKIADLYLAKSNYEDAKREVSRYERILAGEISKLEILLAKMPGTITVKALTNPIITPKPINKGLISASLLDRRPDLRAAEMRIKAAKANVGVAIADLFPDFVISGDVSYAAPQFKQLFSTSNMTTTFLANMVAKIFVGGAIKTNIEIKKSEARALALDYANKIYRATGEAETNLRNDQKLIAEYRSSQAAAKLYKRNREYSKSRYIRGIEKLNNYLENKRKSYQASKLLVEAEQAMWRQRIDLYLSLGGDWSSIENIKLNGN